MVVGLREFVTRRLINSVILVAGAITFNFFVFRLMPGDPVAIILSGTMRANQQALADALRAMWGLDQPMIVQFILYVQNMLNFNFGNSFSEGFRPVIEAIVARLPNTLLLMGTAAIMTIILGVITGITAASNRGGGIDLGMVVTTLTMYSMPTFWLGMMFILLFGFYFPIFPMGSTVSHPVPNDPLIYGVDFVDFNFSVLWWVYVSHAKHVNRCFNRRLHSYGSCQRR